MDLLSTSGVTKHERKKKKKKKKKKTTGVDKLGLNTPSLPFGPPRALLNMSKSREKC